MLQRKQCPQFLTLVVEKRGCWAAWCEFLSEDIACQPRLYFSLLAVHHFGNGQWVYSCNMLLILCLWLTLTEHLLLCQVLLALTGINSSKLPKDPVVIRIIICILWMENSGPERLKDLPKVAWLQLCVLNHFSVCDSHWIQWRTRQIGPCLHRTDGQCGRQIINK